MLSNKQKKAIKVMFKRAHSVKCINITIENLYCYYGNADKIKFMEKRKCIIISSIVLLGWDNKISASVLRQLSFYSKYK